MKRIFGFLVCLLICFGCSWSRPEKAKAQAVAGDSSLWDFGQIKEGVVLKHSFTLKNNLDKPLVLKKIDTSCSCTVSSVQKKMLLPGESTLIEAKFNSKGYSGAVQQFVYVNTDNADNPVLKFTIKANVVKGGT